MTPDQETWAIALHVQRVHGEDGPRWIAERIGALAMQDDDAGVARWKEIATAYEMLMTGRAWG